MFKKSFLLLSVAIGCQTLSTISTADQLSFSLHANRDKADIRAYLPNGKPASAATIIIKDQFERDIVKSTLNSKGHYQFRYPQTGNDFTVLISSNNGQKMLLRLDKSEHVEGGKQGS